MSGITLEWLAGVVKRIVQGSMYPVGSLYFNASVSTNPATLLGFGTWTLWGAGRVPVCVDTSQAEFNVVEKTGGHKALQQHTHSYNRYKWVGSGGDTSVNTGTTWATVAEDTTNAGTGNAGNLQPYITCYIWKRTT